MVSQLPSAIYIVSWGLGLGCFIGTVLRVVADVAARFAIISYGFPLILPVFDATKAHAETITKYSLLIGVGLTAVFGVLSILSTTA